MKLIAIICFFLISSASWACSCAKVTDQEALNDAKAVLLVRITSTEFIAAIHDNEFDSVKANFDVIETYKGKRGDLRYIKAEKTVCEMPLITGDYYLVFSRGGEFEVLNICTRSRWVNLTRDKELLDGLSRLNTQP